MFDFDRRSQEDRSTDKELLKVHKDLKMSLHERERGKNLVASFVSFVFPRVSFENHLNCLVRYLSRRYLLARFLWKPNTDSSEHHSADARTVLSCQGDLEKGGSDRVSQEKSSCGTVVAGL